MKRLLLVFLLALLALPAVDGAALDIPVSGVTRQLTPSKRQIRQPVRRNAFGARRLRQRRTHVARYRNWEELWRAVWAKGTRAYHVHAASTVRSEQLCSGDLAGRINAIVMDTARSINARKYGDAARSLAGFQDSLMCLDVKSMEALDLMMAAFMANAQRLPAQQRQQAVRGMLNMTLLVFDQIQYTGRSYSLPVLYRIRGDVNRALSGYSGTELGLWFFDYGSGTMERRTFGARDARFKDGLMAMISHPGRFRNGECTILEMSAHGFSCGGVPGLGSGGGGGGGGGMPASSGGALGCMTAAAASGGLHGQLQCMARSGGTGGFNAGKGRPSLQMNGILDSFCGGRTSGDPPTLQNFEENPPQHAQADDRAWYEKLWDALTSPDFGSSDSGSAPDAGTPDAGSRFTPEQRRSLMDFSGDGDSRTVELQDFDESQTGGTRGMSEDSSGCGTSTNAVARANRLFSCTGIGGGAPGGGGGRGGPFSGGRAPGTRSMPAPGSSGGYAGGGMSGLMSCAAQGGSLVRTSMNDKRCSQSMCAPGQSCSCNGGGGSAPAEIQGQVRRGIYSPNRPNMGARDPRPDDTGTGGGPTWGGGGGPSINPFGGRGTRGGR